MTCNARCSLEELLPVQQVVSDGEPLARWQSGNRPILIQILHLTFWSTVKLCVCSRLVQKLFCLFLFMAMASFVNEWNTWRNEMVRVTCCLLLDFCWRKCTRNSMVGRCISEFCWHIGFMKSQIIILLTYYMPDWALSSWWNKYLNGRGANH